MAWPSRAPELQAAAGPARAPVPVPTPVPDIERLRRDALQASWRRDRRVARRRTAMRWALWYGIRGLPLLLVVATVSIWLLPLIVDRLQAPSNPPEPVNVPVTVPTTVPPAKSADLAADAAPVLLVPPDSRRDESGIQLRLGSPFQPITPDTKAQDTPPKASDAAAAVPPSSSPQLKPDNWLHSKEP